MTSPDRDPLAEARARVMFRDAVRCRTKGRQITVEDVSIYRSANPEFGLVQIATSVAHSEPLRAGFGERVVEWLIMKDPKPPMQEVLDFMVRDHLALRDLIELAQQLCARLDGTDLYEADAAEQIAAFQKIIDSWLTDGCIYELVVVTKQMLEASEPMLRMFDRPS